MIIMMMMQVGLSAKDMLAREPDLTLYRQLSHYTLQVTFFYHQYCCEKGCRVEAMSDEGCEHVQARPTSARC